MTLLHLGCDGDLRPGFDNLDKAGGKLPGWTFESGLPYGPLSVDGITVSHALMYVAERDWPFVVGEFYRVLKPGGVVRITEDDTESPASGRYRQLYPGAAIATGPQMAARHLAAAGFAVRHCRADQTHFVDGSLLIAHRDPSFVFYIEGIKP